MQLSFTETLHVHYCCIFVDGACVMIILTIHIFCTLGINQVHINPVQCICRPLMKLGTESMSAMASETGPTRERVIVDTSIYNLFCTEKQIETYTIIVTSLIPLQFASLPYRFGLWI